MGCPPLQVGVLGQKKKKCPLALVAIPRPPWFSLLLYFSSSPLVPGLNQESRVPVWSAGMSQRQNGLSWLAWGRLPLGTAGTTPDTTMPPRLSHRGWNTVGISSDISPVVISRLAVSVTSGQASSVAS